MSARGFDNYWLCRLSRQLAACGSRLLLAFGFVMVGLNVVFLGAWRAAPQPVQIAPPTASFASYQLGSELVSALNNGDAGTLTELFDADGTIQADRYAWRTDEIRRWARMQTAESIRIQVDASGIRALPNQAQWTSSVSRRDWTMRGVQSVTMFNEIWTEGNRIVQYSSFPVDGSLVPQLGALWRPGLAPGQAPGQPLERHDQPPPGPEVVRANPQITCASRNSSSSC
jgi:hypothetical protein